MIEGVKVLILFTGSVRKEKDTVVLFISGTVGSLSNNKQKINHFRLL